MEPQRVFLHKFEPVNLVRLLGRWQGDRQRHWLYKGLEQHPLYLQVKHDCRGRRCSECQITVQDSSSKVVTMYLFQELRPLGPCLCNLPQVRLCRREFRSCSRDIHKIRNSIGLSGRGVSSKGWYLVQLQRDADLQNPQPPPPGEHDQQ
jgi:hypothetical protein